MEGYALGFVQLSDELAKLRPENPLHRDDLGRSHERAPPPRPRGSTTPLTRILDQLGLCCHRTRRVRSWTSQRPADKVGKCVCLSPVPLSYRRLSFSPSCGDRKLKADVFRCRKVVKVRSGPTEVRHVVLKLT